MNDRDENALRRENDYLKLRNAQLQRDVDNLSAESGRLRQQLERRLTARTPSLSSGP